MQVHNITREASHIFKSILTNAILEHRTRETTLYSE